MAITVPTADTEINVKIYPLKPTSRIPNNPTKPLLHYPSYFVPASTSPADSNHRNLSPSAVNKIFRKNSWKTHWIFHYGVPHPIAHYHSCAHECMVVLSGEAEILFGVADVGPVEPVTERDQDQGEGEDRFGGMRQEPHAQGVKLRARAGDVFIVPAGVAHKAVARNQTFALLTPGEGYGLLSAEERRVRTTVAGKGDSEDEDEERRETDVLDRISLDGFAMIGAYPDDRAWGQWDFMEGKPEENVKWEEVWGVPRPGKDPVLGGDRRGVLGVWSE